MKRILILVVLLGLLFSCKKKNDTVVVHLWHQMEPAKVPVLNSLIKTFEAQNPDIKVIPLHKGTEELRTGYQAATAFTGKGPELVYGPMDQIGPFEVMKLKNSNKSIIMPLENLFPKDFYEKFDSKALVRYKGHIYQIADRLGNHLALVYNKKLFKKAGISRPPETISELIEFGKKLTVDFDGDGKTDQYGLVWNYTEPFWYVPFFAGYGGQIFDKNNKPLLDSQAAVDAFQLMYDLKNKYKIIPPECDYDIADNKFYQGKAAMIINGDWSWGKYLSSPNVEFGLARIPKVEKTDKWCSPMVSATGYSINSTLSGKELEATKKVLEFLTSKYAQKEFSKKFKAIPSLKELQNSPDFLNDPVIAASVKQIEVGQLMPIIPEMRAVWDAMRPALQSVLGGNMTPKEAAKYQQKLALEKISSMYEDSTKKAEQHSDTISLIFKILGIILALYFTYLLVFKFILALFRNPSTMETKNARFAVLLSLPATLILFGVVVYPFFYNLLISFSNMNMTNVNSWKLIGLTQYIKVFSEPFFYSVFFKTLIWTLVNVFFHVTIGVFLAILLNRHLPGKAIIRVLLILPWAVPQYITALTWRGMFMSDTGAINLILEKLGFHAINWLSQPNTAFIASIITNIWLGFPFMMVIALGALQSIPNELYEAAEIDGAGSWKKFWKITVPLLKPMMIPAITLGIVWTFNNLNVIWLVTNGGQPADKVHILVSYVYRAAFNLYRYGYAAAFSVIIFVILAVFSLLFMNRYTESKPKISKKKKELLKSI